MSPTRVRAAVFLDRGVKLTGEGQHALALEQFRRAAALDPGIAGGDR